VNEIRIKVVADADLASLTKAEEDAKTSGKRTGKNFTDKVKEEVDKTGPVIGDTLGQGIDDGIKGKTKGTGDETGRKIGSEVGRSLNTLLRDLQLPEIDVKADAGKALAELELVKERVRALASDNPSIEVKVRTDRAITEADKFAKLFIKEGEEGAKGFFSKFSDSLGQQFKGFSFGMSEFLPVLGIVAAAAAPGIGATIAGAVVGGVGIGGIVGGVALAAKDPRVQAALVGVRSTITKELTTAAQPFVDVSIKGIHQIGDAVEKIDFKSIFADAAQNAGPLIDGVATAVTALGKGIADVEHNAGPVIKELGAEIGNIGKSIGSGLTSLSHDSREGASAMHELFMMINGTVDATFALVNGLSKTYGALQKISGGGLLNTFDAIGSASAKVAGRTRDIATEAARAVPVLDKYGRAVLTDGASLNEMAQASFTAANAQLGLFGDLTSVARAQVNAAKAARENGRTLDANTEKGRNNRDALTALGSTLVKNSEDYYALNGAGQATQKVMANNRAAFLRAAESMTKSKKEAEALTNAIFGIPNKDVYINVHQVSDGRERVDQSGHRVGGYYAHGGVVGAAASGGGRSGLTMVGERGPELLDLPAGTSVHTAGDSMRMLAAAAGAGQGAQPLVINLELDGERLATVLADHQRRLVNRRFGGDVQAAYGRG
jgi:hypothetical protein